MAVIYLQIPLMISLKALREQLPLLLSNVGIRWDNTIVFQNIRDLGINSVYYKEFMNRCF
jgi:hypothetical protein